MTDEELEIMARIEIAVCVGMRGPVVYESDDYKALLFGNYIDDSLQQGEKP